MALHGLEDSDSATAPAGPGSATVQGRRRRILSIAMLVAAFVMGVMSLGIVVTPVDLTDRSSTSCGIAVVELLAESASSDSGAEGAGQAPGARVRDGCTQDAGERLWLGGAGIVMALIAGALARRGLRRADPSSW